MTEVARMRFKSATKPKEHGTLTLHDDGTFQIKPSHDLRDEMARLEEVALDRSKRISFGVGFTLVGLGAAAIAAGWYLGRKFGNLGMSLSTPRRIEEVEVERDDSGSVHVRLHGIEHHSQTIQMGWHVDEILVDEAETFLAKFNEMKQQS